MRLSCCARWFLTGMLSGNTVGCVEPSQQEWSRSTQGFTTPSPVFVNEIHYENAGVDELEAVEIVGPAGTQLSGWSLELYNQGRTYRSVLLEQSLAHAGQAHGSLVVGLPGLQNGEADGLALVDDQGQVRQLLSYEGTFVALDGPAADLRSTELGVSESERTLAGQSLQLVGSGRVLTDFHWVGPEQASFGAINRNQTLSFGGDEAPRLLATEPAAEDFEVAPDVQLSLEFSEPVSIDPGAVVLACGTEQLPLTLVEGPRQFRLIPKQLLPEGSHCVLNIARAGVHDWDSHDPPDSLVVDAEVRFSVPRPLSISEIQGRGHLSPFLNQVVVTSGVVTARHGPGFFLQSTEPDADVNTSEGLFVVANTPVREGDRVQVTGPVHEFRPGCEDCGTGARSFANLTLTEIAPPNAVSILGTGFVLPPPIQVGEGGRLPPQHSIHPGNGSASHETSVEQADTAFDPAHQALDFYESLEGMQVLLNHAQAVGPTTTFGEIAVVAEPGAVGGRWTARGGLVVRPGQLNPERIIVDDAIISAEPQVDIGTRFAPIRGVVSYSFGNFKLLNLEPLRPITSTRLARETLEFAEPIGGELDVATFNVQNLSPLDPWARYQALARIIVEHLKVPGIVALQEVQDDSGPTNDGVVVADRTLSLLTAAIEEAGGPRYSFAEIPPGDGEDGGMPGANIRLAFLYAQARGVELVGRSGDAVTATQVLGSNPPTLSHNPGRIDPNHPAFVGSRKPLVAEFTVLGEPVFVVANHFVSRSRDQPIFGRFQPPATASQPQRLEQAQAVRRFVQALTRVDPTAVVLVVGDFNDVEFSAPLSVLTGAGLMNPLSQLPPRDRYSYVFDGNSQALDHILVSLGARRRGVVLDIVHVNAEFYDGVSDHDPSVVRIRLQ